MLLGRRQARPTAREDLHQARAATATCGSPREACSASTTPRSKPRCNLDGKYLLRCSDPHLSAEDIALGYKQLLEVERGWRDIKQIIDLRPVYHRREDRIRAHILLCWLALLLIRVVETTTGQTWHQAAPRPQPATRGHLHRPRRRPSARPPSRTKPQTRPLRPAGPPHPQEDQRDHAPDRATDAKTAKAQPTLLTHALNSVAIRHSGRSRTCNRVLDARHRLRNAGHRHPRHDVHNGVARAQRRRRVRPRRVRRPHGDLKHCLSCADTPPRAPTNCRPPTA